MFAELFFLSKVPGKMSVECCSECAELVVQMRQNLNKSMRSISDYALLVERLVAHDNQRVVVEFFEEKLLAAKPEDAMTLFELVDRVLWKVKGKVRSAFEPLLPEICRRVKRSIEKAQMAETARLLMLRRCWLGLFSFQSLHELDHSLREVDPRWPLFGFPTGSLAFNCALCSQARSKVVRAKKEVDPTTSLTKEQQQLLTNSVKDMIKRYHLIKRNKGSKANDVRCPLEEMDSGIESPGSDTKTEVPATPMKRKFQDDTKRSLKKSRINVN